MTRRILDLFCCAGGAGTGYERAGFDVYAIDLDPQPNNPHPFHQGDALEALRTVIASRRIEFTHKDGRVESLSLDEFDAIHASPPCQGYTTMSAKYPVAQALWPQLITPTRKLLEATGKPYVIENVAGARKHMRSPMKLSGGMFGLGVERPRLFESNIPLQSLPFRRADPVVGVYGRSHDGRRLWTRADGTELRAARTLAEGRLAMGIGWMEWHELTEAIPPAFTEHIGIQLLEHISKEAAA